MCVLVHVLFFKHEILIQLIRALRNRSAIFYKRKRHKSYRFLTNSPRKMTNCIVWPWWELSFLSWLAYCEQREKSPTNPLWAGRLFDTIACISAENVYLARLAAIKREQKNIWTLWHLNCRQYLLIYDTLHYEPILWLYHTKRRNKKQFLFNRSCMATSFIAF